MPSRTVTLQPSEAVPNQVFRIVKKSSDANTVTVQCTVGTTDL